MPRVVSSSCGDIPSFLVKTAEMLQKIGRIRDLAPGQKVVRELYIPVDAVRVQQVQLLVIRHPDGNGYSVMDANCFHMGANLVAGDIEDLGNGHSCIVCPWHRKKIDMKTGCVMETNLDGHMCAGDHGEQKQRMYDVHYDDENIFVNIPAHPGKDLPSDRWNQESKQILMREGMQSTGYGILEQKAVPPGSPLQPYAGEKGWPAGSPLPDVAMEDVVDLSQPSQESPGKGLEPRRLEFGGGGGGHNQEMKQFSVRRRAATEAILKKGYKPPSKAPVVPLSDSRQRNITDFFS